MSDDEITVLKESEADMTLTNSPETGGDLTSTQGKATTIAEAHSDQRAIASPTSQMIGQLIDAASRPETDIEKMERLFSMAEKMQAKQAELEYQEAMAEAKREIGPVIARQTNEHTRSTYADLGDIAPIVDPIIARHGFSIDYDEEPCEKQGEIRVVAEIMHSGGHRKKKGINVALDKAGSGGKVNKTDIQAKGSTITYARRYLKLMAFDIAVTDNDGNRGEDIEEDWEFDKITDVQVAELEHLFTIWDLDQEAFCAAVDVKSLEDIPASGFEKAKRIIENRGKAIEAQRHANKEGDKE